MEWSEANHMNVNVKKNKRDGSWTTRQGIGDASHDDSQSASTGLTIQTFRRDSFIHSFGLNNTVQDIKVTKTLTYVLGL